jgi:NAD(P)-dependent dehydrogenase (short-subunit alcohol dehydrogenase family)
MPSQSAAISACVSASRATVDQPPTAVYAREHMTSVDMRGKTVLITGGNAGIGRHTAIELARMGARVVFTSRNLRKGDVARAEIREAANTKLVDTMELDLASFGSIEKFAKQFLAKYERLDVLVLNAGIMLDRRSSTAEGFETTFGVNHLGHFLLTQLLRDRIVASKPARIVVVSSTVHKQPRGLDFDDLMLERGYGALKAYSRSKLANILFANVLAQQLEGTGVTVNALNPGAVRSDFGSSDDIKGPLGRVLFTIGRPFLLSPQRGAQTSIYLASSPEVEGKTGGYYYRSKLAPTSAAAQDRAAAERLWQVSEALVAKARKP